MRRPLQILVVPLLGLAALLAPGAATAAPHLDGTFNVSDTPKYITHGPDGNMWATIAGSKLARVKPNGNVDEFSPAKIDNAVGITSFGGNLWVTQPNEVVRVDPDDPDSAEDFSVNAITDPRAITPGPNNKLWAASGDQLVSFKPSDPEDFDATTINGMGARGITASGGKLWIADFGGQRIVRAKPGGNVKKYNVGGGPQEVAAGPDGSVAYGNPGTDPQTVGRIKKDGGAKTTKDANADPFGVTFMPDNNWWFAEFAKDRLGTLSTSGNLRHIVDLPNNSGPRYVGKGKNGTLWVSLEGSEKIARVKGVN